MLRPIRFRSQAATVARGLAEGNLARLTGVQHMDKPSDGY
jgi:hypothetical protein